MPMIPSGFGGFLQQFGQELSSYPQLKYQREQEALQRAMAERKLDIEEQAARSKDALALATLQETQRGNRFNQAQTISDNLMEGAVTPQAASLLKEFGLDSPLQYGGQTGQVGEAQLALPQLAKFALPENMNAQDRGQVDAALTGSLDDLQTQEVKPTIAPGQAYSTGGMKWQQARQAEQARKDLAAQNAQSRADIAQQTTQQRADAVRANNEMKMMIAQLANAGRGETRDLQNQILQGRIDAQKEKQETADALRARQRQAARRSTTDSLNVLAELIAKDDKGNFSLKPGVSGLYGIGMGRMANPTAEANLSRLQGRMLTDLIGQMKSQSQTGATGFGQLAVKEMEKLENAASTLGHRWQSDDAALKELVRIYDSLQNVLADIEPEPGQQMAGPAAAGPLTKTVYGPNGQTATAVSLDGGKTWAIQ